MACPICNKEKKNFSIKVKDYEYDLKLEALYSQCKSYNYIYSKTKINQADRLLIQLPHPPSVYQ